MLLFAEPSEIQQTAVYPHCSCQHSGIALQPNRTGLKMTWEHADTWSTTIREPHEAGLLPNELPSLQSCQL